MKMTDVSTLSNGELNRAIRDAEEKQARADCEPSYQLQDHILRTLYVERQNRGALSNAHV